MCWLLFVFVVVFGVFVVGGVVACCCLLLFVLAILLSHVVFDVVYCWLLLFVVCRCRCWCCGCLSVVVVSYSWRFFSWLFDVVCRCSLLLVFVVGDCDVVVGVCLFVVGVVSCVSPLAVCCSRCVLSVVGLSFLCAVCWLLLVGVVRCLLLVFIVAFVVRGSSLLFVA